MTEKPKLPNTNRRLRLEQRQLIQVTLIATLVILLAGISPAATYPNSQRFNSGCQTLTYLEYGKGKPLVLLAGGPGMNPAYMAPVAKMLAVGNQPGPAFASAWNGKFGRRNFLPRPHESGRRDCRPRKPFAPTFEWKS
jgi:hypothetical protein